MIHMMQTNIKYSYSKPIGKGFAFNAPWWTLQHSVQWCTLPSRGHHSIARRHTSRRAEHSWFPRICPWFQCDWVTVRSTELFVFLVSGCVGGNCFNCLWCAKWKCNFQWGKKDQDEVVPKIVLKWFTCVFGIETLFCSLFFLVYRSVFVSINTYYVVFTNKYKDQRQWVHVWDHIYKDKYRILSI